MPTTPLDYLPRWTKREVVESSGRDPLGLSRVSDALTSYLLPGIISTTDRARYYSFYPWAIQDAQNKRGDTSFQQAFMQRDSAFGLSSTLGKTEIDLPIVGKFQIEPRIPELQTNGFVETAFPLLPSNEFGPLDQYYATCLQELDIVIPAQDSNRWTVTEVGIALGREFARAIEKTPYIRERQNEASEVSFESLSKSAALFSLDGLRRPEAKAERTLLTKRLFSLGTTAEGKDLVRQQTLGQLLHVLESSRYVQRGGEDFALLFSPHYFDLTYRDAKAYVAYRPHKAWTKTRGLWRQFCAHQYLLIALENFLTALLDSLSPHVEGLSAEDLVTSFATVELTEQLTAFLKKKCRTPTELMSVLGLTAPPSLGDCQANRSRWRPDAGPNESAVLEEQGDKNLDRMSVAILLIALLYGKWRNTEDEQWRAAANQFGSELWIGTFLPEIDTWFGPNCEWRHAIEQLVKFVFARHEQVMFQKRKLEACWISFANNHFFKEQSLQPRFRSARHVNAVRIMYDLGLVDFEKDRNGWTISDSGSDLLATLTET